MTTQSREIYTTGIPAVDIILARIAARLDTIEGLRPDIGTGILQVTSAAGFEIADTSGFQTIVSGVTIADNSVAIESGTLALSDGSTMTIAGGSISLSGSATLALTGGSLTLDGAGMRIDESNITIYDENDEIIHKLN